MNALIALMTLSLMLAVAFPFFAATVSLYKRERARKTVRRTAARVRLETANMAVMVALATHR
ncbi:MAG TPA: hypothetical protein VJJ02_02865 [Candidatus Paceibacterota bacterium]